MKKDTIIISVHSFIDVITNSSTELFVCDTDKSVEVVKSMVDEMQERYPNEYGHRLSTCAMDPNDWRIGDLCNFYGEESEAVKYLEMKGYKVTKPIEGEVVKPKYIEISAERGGLDPRVKSFIESTFNVIHYDFDA
jgi:hypothetical protein